MLSGELGERSSLSGEAIMVKPKNKCFSGYEWFICPATGETGPTGRIMMFLAPSVEEAVQMCLYTEQLHNQKARVGPRGRVVYNGNYSIVFPTPKATIN